MDLSRKKLILKNRVHAGARVDFPWQKYLQSEFFDAILNELTTHSSAIPDPSPHKGFSGPGLNIHSMRNQAVKN